MERVPRSGDEFPRTLDSISSIRRFKGARRVASEPGRSRAGWTTWIDVPRQSGFRTSVVEQQTTAKRDGHGDAEDNQH